MNDVCTVGKKNMDSSIESIRRAYRLLMFGHDPGEKDYYEAHDKRFTMWDLFFETMCVPNKEVVWIILGKKFYLEAFTFEGKC